MNRVLRWIALAAAAVLAVVVLLVVGPYVGPGLVGERVPEGERAPEGRFEAVRPFVAAGAVRVQSRFGRIVVEGWERPEIGLEAVFEAPLYTRFGFAADAEAGEAQVVVERNERGLFGAAREGEIGGGEQVTELVVRVPAASGVEIYSSEAEIRVAGVTGDVRVETVAGPVEVAGEPRAVVVETVVSEVRVTGAAESFTARTIHGPVTVEGAPRSVDVETVAGGVHLVLPADLPASYELRTHGTLDSDRGEVRERDGEYVLELAGGEGEATVRAVSLSGPIRLAPTATLAPTSSRRTSPR